MEVNLETLPIGEDAPETVNTLVEALVGSSNKYEPEIEAIMRGRGYQPMPATGSL